MFLPPRRKIAIGLTLFVPVVVALVIYEVNRPKEGIILSVPKGKHGLALDVDDNGQVVGVLVSAKEDEVKIFTWTVEKGIMIKPFTQGEPKHLASRKTNDWGQQIENISVNGSYYAYVIQKNGEKYKLPLLGGSMSRATGINNKGQVIGFIIFEPPRWHNLWNQAVTKLGLPVGYTFSQENYRYPKVVVWTVPPEEE